MVKLSNAFIISVVVWNLVTQHQIFLCKEKFPQENICGITYLYVAAKLRFSSCIEICLELSYVLYLKTFWNNLLSDETANAPPCFFFLVVYNVCKEWNCWLDSMIKWFMVIIHFKLNELGAKPKKISWHQVITLSV